MRDIAKALRVKFQPAAVEPDRLFLLHTDDAVRLIREASGQGLKLVGVEGFRVWPEGGVQPRQEFSNDIGDVEMSLLQFIERTIELVESGREENVAFEVVFDELGNLSNV